MVCFCPDFSMVLVLRAFGLEEGSRWSLKKDVLWSSFTDSFG